MGKDAFPVTPRERGGRVCLVWGLVVVEPDLGKMMRRECGDNRATHITVDTVYYILWWQVRDLWCTWVPRRKVAGSGRL